MHLGSELKPSGPDPEDGWDREEGEGREGPTGWGTSSSGQAPAGGVDRLSSARRLTVTLKVMAFCRPSGEICSSSATAWISRVLTTEATSCASVWEDTNRNDSELHNLILKFT